MELTVEQALRQGIAAHKEGKLQDAERLYRAILRVHPHHPDANHNLGVLAVLVGKASDALPLFKQALNANPRIEQFWLSYLDGLIKTKSYDDAKRVLSDAKKAGLSANRLVEVEKRLPGETSLNRELAHRYFDDPSPDGLDELSHAGELVEFGDHKGAQRWLNGPSDL